MNVRNLLLGCLPMAMIMALALPGIAADDVPPQPLPEENSYTSADCWDDACEVDACGVDASCADICCSDCCAVPCWQFFGDFLYLRPRNAGLEYAVIMNGPIAPGQTAVQEGRTATLNPQFEPGFRAGLARAFDECSTLSVAYTRYENRSSDTLLTDDETNYPIRSLVVHPSTADAAYDWLEASAHQDIAFDLADAEYRRIFLCDDRYNLQYLAGFRYANLKQRFRSQFASTITENVNTDVNFDGAGIRFGLEGERYSACRRIFLYGKAVASVLGGEFRGSYFQGSTNDPTIVQTTWKEARCVTMLDCELGIGWASASGRLRASAGYMFSGWMNVVKSSEFISAVQANAYHGPNKIDGNGLVFDGLVARFEIRR